MGVGLGAIKSSEQSITRHLHEDTCDMVYFCLEPVSTLVISMISIPNSPLGAHIEHVDSPYLVLDSHIPRQTFSLTSEAHFPSLSVNLISSPSITKQLSQTGSSFSKHFVSSQMTSGSRQYEHGPAFSTSPPSVSHVAASNIGHILTASQGNLHPVWGSVLEIYPGAHVGPSSHSHVKLRIYFK